VKGDIHHSALSFVIDGATLPFRKGASAYDKWYRDHKAAYESEADALRQEHRDGSGLEVGIGTGAFAMALGVEIGLDPSTAMLEVARSRGIEVVKGVAEALPFRDGSFDFVAFVTTLSFVSDRKVALSEARRVVRSNGQVVVGLIDGGSPKGRQYVLSRRSGFYHGAQFLSAEEHIALLKDLGMSILSVRQTIFHDPDEMTTPDPVISGFGDGIFVVITAGV
jgi:SAM-dependent methyltransferase